MFGLFVFQLILLFVARGSQADSDDRFSWSQCIDGCTNGCIIGCSGVTTQKFADCYDVHKAKKPLPGIYTLEPDSHHKFDAHCLEDGWTVIQSRGQFGNPKDYFLRKWDAYVKGFGEPGKEHWIGLNNIYALTNRPSVNMQLRVSMLNFAHETATAFYDKFYLEDRTLYRLRISHYHGSGGDSLNYSNGAPFSTIDKDNDSSSSNCAVSYKGAWWYTKCHESNLNGYNYGTSDKIPFATGIVWKSFTTYDHSLKTDVMAIRPNHSHKKK